MQILNTADLSNKDGMKALVFGPSAVGKTRLLATAPRPFIFSAEKGLLSVKKERLSYADITTYPLLLDAYKWAMTSSEAKKFDTLCLDSLSEIAEIVLAKELISSGDPRKAYGNMQQSMYALIRQFRDMPNKNVVLIAKQTIVQDVAIPIMPSEKLQSQVPYFFDLVLHMFVGKNPTTGVEYTAIHTKAAVNWMAKDRSGNLDPIEHPNLTQLFNKASQ